ncbi:transcriptional coactivator PipX [Synechocystis sp. LKSZ1]|uniref:transcriptional coactivator PipX n=1 Tax=Synechocystis sp. LKSZ1 TaxID=3144951 RepID=UPI00336BB76C
MSNETYLNHPTFGLLYRVCLLDDNQEIFTTLYAQRLFFLVATTANDTKFDPITRADAKLLIENRLRLLRRTGNLQSYQTLSQLYQNNFSF